MGLSNSRHPDVPGGCVCREGSEYNVPSTFASQPVDELHGSRLYNAATYHCVEVGVFNNRTTRRSDDRGRCTPSGPYIRLRRSNKISTSNTVPVGTNRQTSHTRPRRHGLLLTQHFILSLSNETFGYIQTSANASTNVLSQGSCSR